jgi:hypothetical protein
MQAALVLLLALSGSEPTPVPTPTPTVAAAKRVTPAPTATKPQWKVLDLQGEGGEGADAGSNGLANAAKKIKIQQTGPIVIIGQPPAAGSTLTPTPPGGAPEEPYISALDAKQSAAVEDLDKTSKGLRVKLDELEIQWTRWVDACWGKYTTEGGASAFSATPDFKHFWFGS